MASTNERLRVATADVFESWIAGCGAFFERAGVEPGEARRLAITMLSLLEGAFVFCRAMRSTEALEVAGEAAAAQVARALP